MIEFGCKEGIDGNRQDKPFRFGFGMMSNEFRIIIIWFINANKIKFIRFHNNNNNIKLSINKILY